MVDVPTATDGYETSVKEVDTKQRKRLSAETWWNYSPVNTTEFGTENILKFQIPTTDVIFDMSRAYIQLDYLMPVRVVHEVKDLHDDGAATAAKYIEDPAVTPLIYTHSPLVAHEDEKNMNVLSFPGIMNTATIFSLTEMYMDGNLIWHNDYCQTQARLWGLNKNDQWIDSQTQTFFRPTNTDVKTPANVGDIQTVFNEIKFIEAEKLSDYTNSGTNGLNMQHYIRKQLKIPLVMLYPQFEVMNGWPAFLVKQVLYLQLTVSQARKYLTTFMSKSYMTGPYNVNTVDDRMRVGNEAGASPDRPIFRYKGKATANANAGFTDIEFDFNKITIQKALLYLPAHVPEFKEREEYTALVNSGLTYGFKYYNVLSNTTNFKRQENNNSMSLSYNSAVNNLEAVNLLYMREGTEVLYEKPVISTMQTNLGNSWMLAASGTHVENIYERDCDYLRDLLKGWGQNDKKYMQTISEDVIRSYKCGVNYLYRDLTNVAAANTGHQINRDGLYIETVTATGAVDSYEFYPIPGSYTIYFDVSPGDELGVSAGQYARLINLRWENTNLMVGGVVADTVRNLTQDAKLYVCQQTFNTISIGPMGVTIKNPFAEEFSVQNTVMTYSNANYSESGLRTHGFISTHGQFYTPHGLFSFLSKVGRGIKKGIEVGKKIYDTAKPVIDVVKPIAENIPGVGKVIKKGEEIYNTGRGIYEKYGPMVKKGVGIAKSFFNNSKSHGAMRFKVKAMRRLGPEGYKAFQHRIDKYATRPYAHKLLLKDMRRQWATQNGGGAMPHGLKESYKYLPGSHIRRFRFLTTPAIGPGWRSGANNRPMRLMPFGRSANVIPTPNGSMNTKHGLCSPYHGLFDFMKGVAKRAYQRFVPEKVQQAIEPFKEPLKQLVGKGAEIAKQHLGRTIDPATRDKISGIYNVGKKLVKSTGLGALAKKAIMSRFSSHGKRKFKNWAAATIHPAHYITMPHGKHMNRFFAKYYGRKHGNRALALERQMWALGNKRVNDGQY